MGVGVIGALPVSAPAVVTSPVGFAAIESGLARNGKHTLAINGGSIFFQASEEAALISPNRKFLYAGASDPRVATAYSGSISSNLYGSGWRYRFSGQGSLLADGGNIPGGGAWSDGTLPKRSGTHVVWAAGQQIFRGTTIETATLVATAPTSIAGFAINTNATAIVAVLNDSRLYYSTDSGTNWTTRAAGWTTLGSNFGPTGASITFFNDLFIVAGWNLGSSPSYAATFASSSIANLANNWTTATPSSGTTWDYSILASANGVLYAGRSNSNSFFSTTNGTTWNLRGFSNNFFLSGNLRSIISNGNELLFFGLNATNNPSTVAMMRANITSTGSYVDPAVFTLADYGLGNLTIRGGDMGGGSNPRGWSFNPTNVGNYSSGFVDSFGNFFVSASVRSDSSAPTLNVQFVGTFTPGGSVTTLTSGNWEFLDGGNYFSTIFFESGKYYLRSEVGGQTGAILTTRAQLNSLNFQSNNTAPFSVFNNVARIIN